VKKLAIALILCLPLGSSAQWSDDFSDGDFTANPTWSGDAGQFTVNAGHQLQLNGAGAGISYLSTPDPRATLDSSEWRFWIRENFSPSGSNYGRVYLVSDQADLEGSLNGYYLQFGEALSNDAVELFRQTGTTSVSVCRGTAAQIAAAFAVGIRVTRNSAGLWRLYVDASGGTAYALEASGTDVTFTTSAFFGVVCTYTSSNATSFYFDDFYAGPMVVDLTPPALTSASAVSATGLDVLFSEAVDAATAGTVSNYSADNGLGSPSSAVRDAVNLSLVHLQFSTSFPSGIPCQLTVNNVSDLAGNAIASGATTGFMWVPPATPAAFDVIINEIMADPDPVLGLPSAEYVEVYNRSNKSFQLAGWTFSDASSTVTFGSATLLPGAYLILCSASSQPLLAPYGSTYAFSSLPSLNNTGGETLTLKDNNGLQLDRVYYDESYYHDNARSNGGWSLERIDPGFTCRSDLNWRASVSGTGGTPGQLNSVNGTLQDAVAPVPDHVCLLDSLHVMLYFSEPMADSTLADPQHYRIYLDDASYGAPLAALPSDDQLSVLLTLPQPLPNGPAVYTIRFAPALYDCSGNATPASASAGFSFPQAVAPGDVILNEVLAHVRSGGVEFLELYNRSGKTVDLSSMLITRRDLGSGLLDPPVTIVSDCYLLLPGAYVALTDNTQVLAAQYPTTQERYLLKMNLPSLTDAEDDVVLLDNGLNILDELHYYEDWQFPLLNSDAGVSLERLRAASATQDPNNWHSAAETVGFATPGYRNSQTVAVEGGGSEVSVQPEIFSPDDDGYDDVLSVVYAFSDPGFTANVTVYDDRGRPVRNLVRNELLGTTGSFTWDGVRDDHTKAPVGLYVIYVEVFNTRGDVRKYKRSCVVAAKL
jgi:hypothetical protein